MPQAVRAASGSDTGDKVLSIQQRGNLCMLLFVPAHPRTRLKRIKTGSREENRVPGLTLPAKVFEKISIMELS